MIEIDMGMILIYGLCLLILLIIIAIISYFVLKRLKQKKAAIIIPSILIIIVLLSLFMNRLDELFYFKSNVKNDLKLVNLTLKDDFKINKNEVFGFPERYQKTELLISEKDKKRIISEIKNGKYFQECKDYRPLYYNMFGKDSKKITSNYCIKDVFFKESYEQKPHYVAKSTYVALKENSNKLEFNIIED